MQYFIEYFLPKFQVNFSLKPRIELAKYYSLLKYDQIWFKMWPNSIIQPPKNGTFYCLVTQLKTRDRREKDTDNCSVVTKPVVFAFYF